MRRQASLATDPIRGAAQNLVGRGKARSVEYVGVGKLGLLQWMVRVNQASLTTIALHAPESPDRGGPTPSCSRKQGFVPKIVVTGKLRSYACAFQRLRLTCRHEQGLRKNNRRRIRIRQSADASASCSVSSQLDPPGGFSACTVQFTIPSMFNAISSPDRRCGSSEPKRLQSGEMRSPRHDSWRALALNACSI
jgi:hypothetical protein